ncbi:transposase [Pseudonocardia dioxanivorans]|uniref:transposase n=1 Tax=Pseudonocardia dioxanivorans TaxID=240495 RepID=UPI003899FCBA
MCPGCGGVGLLDDHGPPTERISSSVPKRYPPEFRRKVLDLVAAGRRIAQVANDLDISEQTIFVWRRQELIDTGRIPGTTTSENAELMAARRRIAELEAEVAIHRAPRSCSAGGWTQKMLMPLAGRSRLDETGGASPADVVGAWCGLSPSKRLTLEPVESPRRVRRLHLLTRSSLRTRRGDSERWRAEALPPRPTMVHVSTMTPRGVV